MDEAALAGRGPGACSAKLCDAMCDMSVPAAASPGVLWLTGHACAMAQETQVQVQGEKSQLGNCVPSVPRQRFSAGKVEKEENALFLNF